MITTEELTGMLTAKLAEATIAVEDMTGTMDHFEVKVLWSGFEGKSLVEQHQYINEALSGPLNDGRIHALTIKTMTPVGSASK
jgi:stress-induced morphogen